MPRASKLGDKVNMNCPHNGIGTIISCSLDIEINGEGIARKGDVVRCDKCGKTRTIDSGSSDVEGNGLDFARVGDHSTGICDLGLPDCPHTTVATISTGSDDTLCND